MNARWRIISYSFAVHQKREIQYSINYIGPNPVRAAYVETPEKWPWASARATMTRTGLVPDDHHVPVLME